MSLGISLTLKDDGDVDHTFNQVDQPPGQPGTKRVDIAAVDPSATELVIRHSQVNSGNARADRHNSFMTILEPDVNGVLQRSSISLTITRAKSSAITTTRLTDALHMLFDLYVSTGTFDIDGAKLAAVLRGES